MTTHLTHLQCPYLTVGNVVGLAIGLAWCNGGNGKAPCVVIQVYASTLTTTCSGLSLDSPNVEWQSPLSVFQCMCVDEHQLLPLLCH